MIIDYDESILRYVASIRKYYGLDSSFQTSECFDDVLNQRKPKRIFLLLIDGLGYNLLERKLPKDSFLRRNIFFKTTTVFPPTTTAATTSIQNGKAPNENAWLSWTQYFKEVDDIVIPFLGTGFYNDKKYGSNFAYNSIPVETTVEELNKRNYKARILFPSFKEDGCETFKEMCDRLVDYSNNKEYDYIYSYWDGYDTVMHLNGPSSKVADEYLEELNSNLECLARDLGEDTMLVVTADHGQIDVEETINLYPKYIKYLSKKPSLEFRTTGFYIKEDLKGEFERVFKEEFEKDFILLTHNQVLQTELFGTRDNHPRFEEFIGDYLAIAKTKKSFKYQEFDNKEPDLKGQHAGMLEDEILIPVIAFIK